MGFLCASGYLAATGRAGVARGRCLYEVFDTFRAFRRFFELYSLYLEELVSTPGYEEEGCAVLAFPWEVPHLLARDERLVELIRGGYFDPLLPTPADPSVQRWLSQILTAEGLG